MISAPIKATNLQDYYDKLCRLQSDAHTPSYMLVHDEIVKRLTECESYTEFGINQGATLAAALLQSPPVVRAYDISLKWYNKSRHHFEQHAKDNKIDFKVFEEDTLKSTIEPADLLYIDTLHKYEHLRKELARHHDKVNNYIIFHDTTAKPGLRRAVVEFVKVMPVWSIVSECKISVGYMTISK